MEQVKIDRINELAKLAKQRELTAEEARMLINSEEDELTEDNLEDVTGGCKCKGILKRAVTKLLQWIVKTATGIYVECPDCGH